MKKKEIADILSTFKETKKHWVRLRKEKIATEAESDAMIEACTWAIKTIGDINKGALVDKKKLMKEIDKKVELYPAFEEYGVGYNDCYRDVVDIIKKFGAEDKQ